MSKADHFQPMSHSEKRLMFVTDGLQKLELALLDIFDDPGVSEAVLTNIVSRVEQLFINMEDKVGWNADLVTLLHQVLDNHKEDMNDTPDGQ